MLFTSEQVSNGHPDKICDQISDAIVTDCLLNDRDSRVAVECMIKDYDIIIAGEITSSHTPDFKDLTYSVLAGIELPNIEQYTVNRLISKQSPDIALGVDQQGAGDQGMMFGYATNETREMLPVPFVLATAALERLKDSRNPFLLPDAKSQVTYDYKRKRIDTFLISTQHTKHASLEAVREAVQMIMRETAQVYDLNTAFKRFYSVIPGTTGVVLEHTHQYATNGSTG